MNSWVFEVILIAPLSIAGGRLLTLFFKKLAPRSWCQHSLPRPSSSASFYLGLEFLLFAVLFAVGTGVIGGLIGTEVAWHQIFAILLSLAGVVWGTYSLLKLHLWWLLEPGCPLREKLDLLSERAGFAPKRVRLRESNRILPRIFPDGSIELTTNFFTHLPDEEQAFLQAATLHQYRQRSRWKQLGVVALAIACIDLLVYLAPMMESNTMLMGILTILGVSAVMNRVQSRPHFSKKDLQFALELTGDYAVAYRAIHKEDPNMAEQRLSELSLWWQTRQSAQAITTHTATVPMQQQTLGHKP
ncbi:MAG: hypothetical protein QM758_26170 [Armatimonas sp.]